MPEPARGTAARAFVSRLVAPHRPVLTLIVLACMLYLPGVWLRDLWNPDEPRYAEVAREMVARDDYMLPHLNGQVYGEKPPLFFWLGILAGHLPGVPFESGPRLVSMLAALGTLLLMFRLGRRHADAETGWLAALVLATSSMFVIHASSGVIDGTLTFLVVAAIAAGLRAQETASPMLWALFYTLVGLAILAKGPVGLAIAAGVLVLMGLQYHGARGARATHPVWGLIIILAVAAAWLVPAISRGGADYAQVILFKQNVGRAYESWHHKEPLQFFLKVFPGSFLPWIVVLPGALYGAWAARGTSRAARLGLTWFLFTFIFFSVISGKKTRYLLPLFPAASLLVALELRALLPGARRAASWWRQRLPLALSGAALALMGLALVAAPFGPAERLVQRLEGLAPDQEAGLLESARLPGGLALLLPGIVVACLGLWGLSLVAKDGRAALACVMAGWIAMVAWAQWIGVPVLNHVKSARPLAEAALRAAGPRGEIVLYRESYAGIFNVYTSRDEVPVMSDLDRTAAWLRERPGAVVVSGAGDIDRLREQLTTLETLACRRFGDDRVCVARSSASPGRLLGPARR